MNWKVHINRSKVQHEFKEYASTVYNGSNNLKIMKPRYFGVTALDQYSDKRNYVNSEGVVYI